MADDINKTINRARSVYDLLITGEIQKTVCRRLHLSKARTSELTSLLLDAGYIVCTTPRSKVKIYAATKKPFLAKELISLNSTRESRTKENRAKNIIQIQKGAFTALFLKPPVYLIPWRKSWTANKVKCYCFSTRIEDVKTPGDILFIRIIGRTGKDVLRILLPRMNYPVAERQSQNSFRRELAERARAWFEHEFKCYLGDLSMGQLSDFAMRITEVRVIEAAQWGTYRIGDLTVDMSKPHELAELESKSLDHVMRYIALPDHLNAVEIRVYETENRLVKVEAHIDQTDQAITTLKTMFSSGKKQDDFIDVT